MRDFLSGLLLCACIAALSAPAMGALVIPGADGSDGVFNPTSSVEVDLSQAVAASWDTPSPQPGKGVCDAAQWAVVFKYSSVDIPSGVTVTFKNRAANPPVVWLVSGNVSIAGTVNLDGVDYAAENPALAAPGPGGFRGGSGASGSLAQSSGFGPGGAVVIQSGGAYAASATGNPYTYGNPQILPLIGGSGGGSVNWRPAGGGGAGGGALLLASTLGVTVTGNINARGGRGVYDGVSGSGGAVRVVCDTFSASSLSAIRATSKGSAGSAGRIRIEANQTNLLGLVVPDPSVTTPDAPVLLWLPAEGPRVKVVQVGGAGVPAAPMASFIFPQQDLTIADTSPVIVRLEARNVPVDGTWKVAVRLGPRYGAASWTDAVFVSGDLSVSIWEATVTIPEGFCALQARAYRL